MPTPLALPQGAQRIHRPLRVETVAFVAFMVALRELQNSNGSISDSEVLRKSGLSRAALDIIQHQEGVLRAKGTLAYVRACGGDETYWRGRQQKLIRTIWSKALILLVALILLFLFLPLAILTLRQVTDLTVVTRVIIGCDATLFYAWLTWYPIFDVDWFRLRPDPDAGPDEALLATYSLVLGAALITPLPTAVYEWFRYSSLYCLTVYPFAGLLYCIRRPVSQAGARIFVSISQSGRRAFTSGAARLPTLSSKDQSKLSRNRAADFLDGGALAIDLFASRFSIRRAHSVEELRRRAERLRGKES